MLVALGLLLAYGLPAVWRKVKGAFGVTGNILGKDEAEKKQEAENMAYAKKHVGDNGGVAVGFNPMTAASNLKSAMDKWGTDEDEIFRILGKMTCAMVLATYIAFGSPDGDNLETWLINDLGGADRIKALGYLTNAGLKC